MARSKRRRRLPRARGNCRHFIGDLAGCSRNGLTAITAAHSALITGGHNVVCSINLDSCRRAAEPGATRWDYVLVLGSGDGPGAALEVHHAAVSEVSIMIRKKYWAQELLRSECPHLAVTAWHWIVPSGKGPFFTRNDPRARALYQEGIRYPKATLAL